MKLLRAVPALLALSLLTGCDVNALLAKTGPGNNSNQIPNNDQQLDQVLTDAELKSVAAFQGGLVDAAGQGLAAAGTVNALKSVAALRSVSAYRIASAEGEKGEEETPWEGPDWETFDWDQGGWSDLDPGHENYDSLKDIFDGGSDGGTLTSDTPKGWYLKGNFTLADGFTAEGKAGLVTNDKELTASTLNEFKASAYVEVTITTVPGTDERLKMLEGTKLALTLTNPEGGAGYLRGEFMLNDDPEAKGTLIVDLLDDSWTVVIPTENEDGEEAFISLTKSTDGGWIGRVFGAKDEQDNLTNQLAEFNWNDDGALRINGKATEEKMPL